MLSLYFPRISAYDAVSFLLALALDLYVNGFEPTIGDHLPTECACFLCRNLYLFSNHACNNGFVVSPEQVCDVTLDGFVFLCFLRSRCSALLVLGIHLFNFCFCELDDFLVDVSCDNCLHYFSLSHFVPTFLRWSQPFLNFGLLGSSCLPFLYCVFIISDFRESVKTFLIFFEKLFLFWGKVFLFPFSVSLL